MKNNINCAKWSETIVSMFPEVVCSVLPVVKKLSMRVFDLGLKRVDFVTSGTREDEQILSRQSAVLESFLSFNESTLKSTIRWSLSNSLVSYMDACKHSYVFVLLNNCRDVCIYAFFSRFLVCMKYLVLYTLSFLYLHPQHNNVPYSFCLYYLLIFLMIPGMLLLLPVLMLTLV